MAIADVLRVIQQLKREGVVRDYILFGSVAAMVHTRPFYTQDVDIGIAAASDSEFSDVLRRLADFGTTDGMTVAISGTPVEVFPVDSRPIIQDAIAHALRKRVEGILVKVTPPEHLVLEALSTYRNKDKARVFLLEDVVDRTKLGALLRRLDHDGTLRSRYEALTRTAP